MDGGLTEKITFPFRRDLRIFKGKMKKVIAVDADNAATTNPFIDAFHMIDNDSLPLDDESVDLCVCDYVPEHIEKPDHFFLRKFTE